MLEAVGLGVVLVVVLIGLYVTMRVTSSCPEEDVRRIAESRIPRGGLSENEWNARVVAYCKAYLGHEGHTFRPVSVCPRCGDVSVCPRCGDA